MSRPGEHEQENGSDDAVTGHLEAPLHVDVSVDVGLAPSTSLGQTLMSVTWMNARTEPVSEQTFARRAPVRLRLQACPHGY